jgi:hypothetical protein
MSRNQKGNCLPPLHLKKETDPFSETLCSSEYWTMDKLKKKNSNPESQNFLLYFRIALRACTTPHYYYYYYYYYLLIILT